MTKDKKLKEEIYNFLDKRKNQMHSTYSLANFLSVKSYLIDRALKRMIKEGSVIKYTRGGRNLVRLKRIDEFTSE